MSDAKDTASAARAETIAKRMAREKAALVEQLKKIPIVQVACEKVTVSRATYYNWRKDDPEFARMTDEAIGDGTGFVNDMAESQLLSAIRDGNLGAITYWLKHRHSAYGNRLEVNAKVNQQTNSLTNEEEAAVQEALRLASLQLPSLSQILSPSPHATTEPTADGAELAYTESGSPTETGEGQSPPLPEHLPQQLHDPRDPSVPQGNDSVPSGGKD